MTELVGIRDSGDIQRSSDLSDLVLWIVCTKTAKFQTRLVLAEFEVAVLQALTDDLLPAVSLEAGREFERDSLKKGCRSSQPSYLLEIC